MISKSLIEVIKAVKETSALPFFPFCPAMTVNFCILSKRYLL